MPQKKYITLSTDHHSIKCLIEGEGSIPCLFIGPGSLYLPTIPDNTKTELFTFYDVDRYFAYPIGEDKVNVVEIESLTLDSYIEYYETCRNALNLSKIAVMGPSAIGLVAYEYAKRFPDVISHVILLGTPSTTKGLVERQNIFFEGNYNPGLYPKLATSWSTRKWLNFKQAQEQFIEEKKSDLTADESLIKELVADQEKYSIDSETESVLRSRWQRFNTTMRKQFFGNMISAYEMEGEVIVPTLAISGMYDGIAPFYDIGDKIAEGVIRGNITQIILDDAAHSPQLESKQFTQCIREWLTNLNSEKSFHFISSKL